MTRFFTAILIIVMLGGCVLVPGDYGDHGHRHHWGNHHHGSHYWRGRR